LLWLVLRVWPDLRRLLAQNKVVVCKVNTCVEQWGLSFIALPKIVALIERILRRCADLAVGVIGVHGVSRGQFARNRVTT
jgi:hypothetical protein